jgi:AraC family transcriptional regulator, exoenzyme S synthesis regulatory protein ExsA
MSTEYNKSMVFNYLDVFFSYYFNDETRCHKMIENHTLVYVYSGELLVEENDKQTKIHNGQCVFNSKQSSWF